MSGIKKKGLFTDEIRNARDEAREFPNAAHQSPLFRASLYIRYIHISERIHIVCKYTHVIDEEEEEEEASCRNRLIRIVIE